MHNTFNNYLRSILIGTIVLMGLACKNGDESLPSGMIEPDEQYAGGVNGTTFDTGKNAFGQSVNNLSNEENNFFVTGNSFFRANWVTAPSSVQSLDGLGPLFNAISCGSCHFKDGRAQPPDTPDEALNGLLFRLSIPGINVHGGPLGEPNYGGQLQDKSILQVKSEGRVRVTYEEITGKYADGSNYFLRRPKYEWYDLQYGNMAPGWMFSPRIAQQIPGLGLLEVIPENEILKKADPDDINKDGITGRPNYVWNEEKQTNALGRFGWKANQPSLLQQTGDAFNGDIGITSDLFPLDHLTPSQQQQYQGVANGGTPEISNESLQKIVLYVRTLAIPVRREHDDPVVLRGKYLFNELNCSGCHQPHFTTGNTGQITALHNQKIWPYTDLLLHDMGSDLADGRPDYLADGFEWRTPPLWGIGLVSTVNNHTYFLHDGRARNIEEAILWHNGEGKQANEGFKNLDQADREALIRFINSL